MFVTIINEKYNAVNIIGLHDTHGSQLNWSRVQLAKATHVLLINIKKRRLRADVAWSPSTERKARGTRVIDV